MKRYEKLVQTDKRGQIVIPKDVRQELGIDETTGFYVYLIPGEGILLKQVEPKPLDKTIDTLTEYAEKLNVDPNALKQVVEDYTKTTGGFKEL